MTIYFVKNFIEGSQEYFVETQKDVDENTNLNLLCIVGTKEQAQTRQQEIAVAYLEAEKDRFVVTKEIQTGDDVTWMTVEDLNTDEHTGAYQIFNTVTGQYEKANTKQEAFELLARIKQDFLVFSGLTDVIEVEELPVPYSKERHGITTGTIPVEVM